jgi:SAM-dependent methyltransferase
MTASYGIASGGSRVSGVDVRPRLTPEPLLELGFGFWSAKALLSAVELGVFAALVHEPLSAEALGDQIGLHPRGRRDFLDALVSLGLLERDNGSYSNTPLTSQFLDPSKPTYVGAMLALCNNHLYWDWGRLTESLRSGLPQREIAPGGDAFSAIYQVSASTRQFTQAMTGASQGLAQAIARQFPWARYQTFADVGCAEGGVTVQLARLHPHLTGVGLDLPPVRPIFETYVAGNGLTDRLRFLAGDVCTDSLPASDVILFGHLLHGLDLEGKQLLLAKAHAALPENGALIVFDMIIDDERRQNSVGLLMSLNMLLETTGGFDYTGADCLGWVRDAGFREVRIEPLIGPHSMVVGIK